MPQGQPRQDETTAVERSLGRWFLYWVLAFLCLTLFYGALWLPLLDWVLGDAEMSPDAPPIDRGVAWLIGGLVKGFFYLLGFVTPAMFTVFAIAGSAEPVDKPVQAQIPTREASEATDGEAEPVEMISGWGVLVVVLLVPGLILLYGAAQEFRLFLSLCLWDDQCPQFWLRWPIL